jgi:outer membrane protein insertion porin family
MIKKWLLPLCLMSLMTSTLYAAPSDSFVVKHIQVDGLKRIKLDTVYSYLPFKLGETITSEESNQIIAALYKSGFFSNIVLERQGSTLIIQVVERPVISSINLKGNKDIKTDDLLKALKSSGIASGFDYNPSTVDQVQNILLQQYFAQSKYSAKVHIDIKKLSDDRVDINIQIDEGKEAKIQKVTVIGNHAFSENTLLDQFKLSPPNLLSFFTKNDLYSREKMMADLDNLKSFYLNHGYLKYQLDSSQVSITPDLEWVYIVAHITEGEQYKFSGYKFIETTPVLSPAQLQKLETIKTGDIFSRQKIVDTEKAITSALNDLGYARADAQVTPAIDDKAKTVFITFNINPGDRVYIRNITFTGNYETNDYVLRRQLKQMEGSLSSAKNIDQSKTDLQRLGYITNADVTTTPVADKPNEEDLNYDVKEYPSASFSAGVGYSDLDGLLFNVNLNQKSFLGTGNSLNVGFQRSASLTSYNVDYYNPYYSLWGVGREISFNYSDYHAAEVNISNYATNTLAASVSYSIPITDYLAYQVGYGYQDLVLSLSGSSSTTFQNYANEFGRHFYEPQLNAGLTYNSYNRAILPTQGSSQSLGVTITAPASPNSLRDYRANYTTSFYQPLYQESWLLNTKTNIGYGNGYGKYAANYPFFQNFYAGGMGSVRGFEGNTLGPQDSNGDPLGGNMVATGTIALVFPNPISANVRTSYFVDGGNVFNSYSGHGNTLGIRGLQSSQLRYSTGIEVDWVSPMGATLQFALAKALNAKPGDNTSPFGFNIGAAF